MKDYMLPPPVISSDFVTPPYIEAKDFTPPISGLADYVSPPTGQDRVFPPISGPVTGRYEAPPNPIGLFFKEIVQPGRSIAS